MIFEILKVFIPATLSFVIGIALTPLLTHHLYKRRMWKKRGGKIGLDGKPTEIFNSLHREKEVGTPRFGGVIVWGSVLLSTALFSLLGFFHNGILSSLDFLSRGQTWLPLATLLIGAFVGLVDDFYEVSEKASGSSQGLPMRKRLLIVAFIAVLCAWWFYTKLDVSSIMIPLWGPLELGVFFMPFFVFVALAMYAAGIIDGIDGLAGGVFASLFAAYAGIAFFQNQLDLAAFCGATAGALLAFLWFNIPPARFYLSETGTMGLTLAATVVAFLTDTLGEGVGVFVLPIIGIMLVATVLSTVLQVLSKRLLGRKLLRVAPLHHHFEAIGWPGYKVTMRYWVVSLIGAIVGISISLVS